MAVLNAGTTPGVAPVAADRLGRAGSKPGVVTNAPRSRQLSVVLYAPGSRPAALAIARRERIARVARSAPPCVRRSAARPASS